MKTNEVEDLIRKSVASEVAFRQFDPSRLGVALPLRYGDGDACEVVVQVKSNGHWSISDEGHVLALGRMQGINLLSPGYADRFRRIAQFFGAEEHEGEVRVLGRNPDQLGDALFVFCQACLELSRLLDLPPDSKRRRRAFRKRFRAVVEAAIPRGLDKDWHDPTRDPKGIYGVDYRVKGSSVEWLIFGAGSPGKCWKAASSVQHYKLENLPLETVCAYSESAKSDNSAFEALADNMTHRFSLERERAKLTEFLRQSVRR